MKISLPYIPDFFEKTLGSLKKHNIILYPKNTNNLTTIVKKGKDRTELNKETNVVYKITCKDCPASYVGQTKRQLQLRINEHKNDYKKEPGKHSVITSHMLTQNHKFDFDNTIILDKEKQLTKRLISEMLHINLQHSSINKKEDSQTLHLPYKTILKKLRSNSSSS